MRRISEVTRSNGTRRISEVTCSNGTRRTGDVTRVGGTRRARRVTALAVVLLSGATACSGGGTSDVKNASNAHPKVIGTGADKQLQWIVQASHHLPISDADAQAHVEPATLKAFGGAAGLTKALERVGPLSPQVPAAGTKSRSVGWFTGARKATLLGTASTNPNGRIVGLFFARQPGSWSELDAEMHRLAPEVSFASAEIGKGGDCKVLHGVNERTARPLGSAFKLYVLGALSDAVAKHQVSWNTPLAIKDEWKSLPSGTLQTRPAGTKLTLAQYAEYMIGISDNTAADHLINRLGRDTVERELPVLGNRRPQHTQPFLTTREMFALKGSNYPATAKSYLALPRAKRYGALAGLDTVPPSKLTAWQEPRDIDSIEWFASPTDMCAAFKGLSDRAAAPGQAEVNRALSLNDGVIDLDPKTHRTVWFKGGSEPGVLTANYLTRTAKGRTFVTSVMLSNRKAAFPATAELSLVALARAGVMLSESADA
ncbi:serine hydrolase [Actinomadura gamaensis]|uniref:Serine hydrolase n=1 Tax=Actinomadura gamaensis TaxID=1763541 RepID=A0ABV9U3G7_9ACTN